MIPIRTVAMRVVLVVLLGLGSAGCGASQSLFGAPDDLPEPFVSGAATPLVLTASISKAELAIGDTATLTLTVRNPSASAVTLNFSSTCQVLPFIWDARSMVHPREGGWGCGAALTQLTIGAGASHVRSVVVHGGVLREPSALVALNPGEHFGYLELGDRMGRSPPVRWRILSR